MERVEASVSVIISSTQNKATQNKLKPGGGGRGKGCDPLIARKGAFAPIAEDSHAKGGLCLCQSWYLSRLHQSQESC